MRPHVSIIGFAFVTIACGASAGRSVDNGGDRVPGAPARVSSTTELSVEVDDVIDWPTDSGLDGADAERLRVATAGRAGRGGDEPLVTIVTFSDFECPYCGRVNPTLERLLVEFPDEVRIVFRNRPLPFHANARMAAMAALEARAQAGDEGFWRMHDLLFANQRSLDRQSLEVYASQLGLDVAGFRAALDAEVHAAEIQEDQDAALRLGARGTPTFFLNGRKLVGAQPFTAFEEIVDEEIAIAREAMNRGVARGDLYASVLQAAAETPAPVRAAPERGNANARPPPRRPDPAAVHDVPVGSSPTRGPADALVTIVELSDFECPFCARVQPTLTELERRYGQDLRIVWKHHPLPFHADAEDAHRAALEARAQRGDQGFWEMHDLLFSNQRELGRRDLEGYASQAGLSLRRFKRAMGRDAHQVIIDEDVGLAQRLGVRGTPAFFINGRFISGAQPIDAFTRVIDEELAKARALVAEGTPRSQVYARTVDGGAQALVYIGGAAPTPNRPNAADRVYAIPVPTNAPSRGSPSAPVTLQVFSDFQCPFCARLVPTLEAIEREYGQQVRVVWRNYPLPFHQHARQAHRAALEVFHQGGDRKFWAYHDLLFANQRNLARADLIRYARRVAGIDAAELSASLDAERYDDVIAADIEAVRDAGAQIGTPSVFVNGRLVQGAQPIDAFRTAIDRALSEAAQAAP